MYVSKTYLLWCLSVFVCNKTDSSQQRTVCNLVRKEIPRDFQCQQSFLVEWRSGLRNSKRGRDLALRSSAPLWKTLPWLDQWCSQLTCAKWLVGKTITSYSALAFFTSSFNRRSTNALLQKDNNDLTFRGIVTRLTIAQLNWRSVQGDATEAPWPVWLTHESHQKGS